MDCDCCEINDYNPAGVDDGDAVPGSCLNCGHAPEEHGEPAPVFEFSRA